MTSTSESSPSWSAWKHIRFACMLCVIGWFAIYRMSQQSAKLPEFVYVNF